jgi:hypothetical protein
LAKNENSGEMVALKQFPKKQSSIGSSKVEVAIFDALCSSATLNHPGHKFISHLLETINGSKD